MDAIVDSLLTFISDENYPVGLAVIALSAMMEYIVPPFPGDAITLFSAVLITAHNWSFSGVFGAVMLGSVTGAMTAFYAGAWLQARRLARRRKRTKEPEKEREKQRAILDDLIGRFRRYGAAYLILNRFLPGIRVFFFVAAGMARMRAPAVFLYSAVSAALWNLGLIALGSFFGANFETLLDWARQYTIAVWIILGPLLLGLAVRIAVLRRRARPGRDDSAD